MSRIGKLPIAVPKGVEVVVEGNLVKVKGPKGQISQVIEKGILVEIDGDTVHVKVPEGSKDLGKFQGLYRSLIQNMVDGVSKGFSKELSLVGVGYRATVKGKDVDLQLGFSHPTIVGIPEGIEVKVDKNTEISITGCDKQAVGQFAASLRALRPPEPYKGKGIRYRDEHVRRKAGKSGKK